MPIRRATLQLSLAAAASLVAGCGGGSASPPEHQASAAPPPTVTPVAKASKPVANASRTAVPAARGHGAHAQFASFAKVVNLQLADLPGFAVAAKEAKHPQPNRAFEGGSTYERCFNTGKEAKPLFKRKSSKFKAGAGLQFVEARSEVEVKPTAAAAHHELLKTEQALASRAARRCLASAFDSLGAHTRAMHLGKATVRVKVGDLRVAPISLSAATHATDGGVGFSMSMVVTYYISARGRTFTRQAPVEFDGLDFVTGRTAVSLTTSAFGTSFPPQLEAKLLSRLIARADGAGRVYPAVRA